jgi:hypothetical protein
MRILCTLLLILIVTMILMRPACGDEKMLTLPELGSHKIMGILGKPLGTVVLLEGVVLRDSYRRLKSDEGEILLKVERIDGKPRPGDIIIRFRPSYLASIPKPVPGDHFRYAGYETGAFEGIPDEAFKYIPRSATTGFQFETHFEAIGESLK